MYTNLPETSLFLACRPLSHIPPLSTPSPWALSSIPPPPPIHTFARSPLFPLFPLFTISVPLGLGLGLISESSSLPPHSPIPDKAMSILHTSGKEPIFHGTYCVASLIELLPIMGRGTTRYLTHGSHIFVSMNHHAMAPSPSNDGTTTPKEPGELLYTRFPSMAQSEAGGGFTSDQHNAVVSKKEGTSFCFFVFDPTTAKMIPPFFLTCVPFTRQSTWHHSSSTRESLKVRVPLQAVNTHRKLGSVWM